MAGPEKIKAAELDPLKDYLKKGIDKNDKTKSAREKLALSYVSRMKDFVGKIESSSLSPDRKNYYRSKIREVLNVVKGPDSPEKYRKVRARVIRVLFEISQSLKLKNSPSSGGGIDSSFGEPTIEASDDTVSVELNFEKKRAQPILKKLSPGLKTKYKKTLSLLEGKSLSLEKKKQLVDSLRRMIHDHESQSKTVTKLSEAKKRKLEKMQREFMEKMRKSVGTNAENFLKGNGVFSKRPTPKEVREEYTKIALAQNVLAQQMKDYSEIFKGVQTKMSALNKSQDGSTVLGWLKSKVSSNPLVAQAKQRLKAVRGHFKEAHISKVQSLKQKIAERSKVLSLQSNRVKGDVDGRLRAAIYARTVGYEQFKNERKNALLKEREGIKQKRDVAQQKFEQKMNGLKVLEQKIDQGKEAAINQEDRLKNLYGKVKQSNFAVSGVIGRLKQRIVDLEKSSNPKAKAVAQLLKQKLGKFDRLHASKIDAQGKIKQGLDASKKKAFHLSTLKLSLYDQEQQVTNEFLNSQKQFDAIEGRMKLKENTMLRLAEFHKMNIDSQINSMQGLNTQVELMNDKVQEFSSKGVSQNEKWMKVLSAQQQFVLNAKPSAVTLGKALWNTPLAGKYGALGVLSLGGQAVDYGLGTVVKGLSLGTSSSWRFTKVWQNAARDLDQEIRSSRVLDTSQYSALNPMYYLKGSAKLGLGVVRGVTDIGSGLVQLAADPDKFIDGVGALVTTPKLWGEMLGTIVAAKDWKAGQFGYALGKIIPTALSTVTGVGAAKNAAHAAKFVKPSTLPFVTGMKKAVVMTGVFTKEFAKNIGPNVAKGTLGLARFGGRVAMLPFKALGGLKRGVGNYWNSLNYVRQGWGRVPAYQRARFDRVDGMLLAKQDALLTAALPHLDDLNAAAKVKLINAFDDAGRLDVLKSLSPQKLETLVAKLPDSEMLKAFQKMDLPFKSGILKSPGKTPLSWTLRWRKFRSMPEAVRAQVLRNALKGNKDVLQRFMVHSFSSVDDASKVAFFNQLDDAARVGFLKALPSNARASLFKTLVNKFKNNKPLPFSRQDRFISSFKEWKNLKRAHGALRTKLVGPSTHSTAPLSLKDVFAQRAQNIGKIDKALKPLVDDISKLEKQRELAIKANDPSKVASIDAALDASWSKFYAQSGGRLKANWKAAVDSAKILTIPLQKLFYGATGPFKIAWDGGKAGLSSLKGIDKVAALKNAKAQILEMGKNIVTLKILDDLLFKGNIREAMKLRGKLYTNFLGGKGTDAILIAKIEAVDRAILAAYPMLREYIKKPGMHLSSADISRIPPTLLPNMIAVKAMKQEAVNAFADANKDNLDKKETVALAKKLKKKPSVLKNIIQGGADLGVLGFSQEYEEKKNNPSFWEGVLMWLAKSLGDSSLQKMMRDLLGKKETRKSIVESFMLTQKIANEHIKTDDRLKVKNYGGTKGTYVSFLLEKKGNEKDNYKGSRVLMARVDQKFSGVKIEEAPSKKQHVNRVLKIEGVNYEVSPSLKNSVIKIRKVGAAAQPFVKLTDVLAAEKKKKQQAQV